MARKKQASNSNPAALEALAALGRRKRELAARDQRQSNNLELESAARRRERQVKSTLRVESGHFVSIVMTAVFLPTGVIWAGYTWMDEISATWLMLGTLTVTGLLAFVSLRSLGESRLAHEQARLASLPFAVTGYFEAIGAEPRGSCTLDFELRFRGQAIDKSTARDVGGVVDAELKEVEGFIARFTSADLDCSVNDGNDTNGPVLHFMRRVIEQVALPLHDASPLEKVSFHRQ